MKKKGFTLIELLAVIVILAIVALIATPIVMNVIENSKKGAAERSAENYLRAVETTIATERLENIKMDGTYLVNSKGNLCPEIEGVDCSKEKEIIVEVSGNKPTSGTIVIDEGKIEKAILIIDGYTVKNDFNNNTGFVTGVLLTDYLQELYKSNKTVANGREDGTLPYTKLITYNIDTANGLIDDGLGGTISSGGNIRYYGAKPANYIDIGDRTSDGKVIPWRIIGLFRDVEVTDDSGNVVETKDLVKVVRDDSIGKYVWDYNPGTGDVAGENTGEINWNTSSLKDMLNGGYYNSSTTSYYVEDDETKKLELTSIDFSSIGLSEQARNKVVNVLWHLGGTTNLNTRGDNHHPKLYSAGYYIHERGEERYSESYPTTISAKVGLMYPSDYGYATDFNKCNSTLYNYSADTDSYVCRSNDWLFKGEHQFTMSVSSSAQNIIRRIKENGGVEDAYYWSDSGMVRPTLYLNADLILTGGTGKNVKNAYVVK